MATTARTWNGRPSPYWQHNEPIACPKKHTMGWLGSVFWICSRCKTIYVQVADKAQQAQEKK